MIEVKDLVKYYGDLKVLNEINFQIEDGTFFGILGPNGAGKTTFVRIMSSLTEPTSGCILVDGEEVSRNNSKIKSKIGIVSQHTNLEREMSVYKNLELHARLFGIEKEKREGKILEELEFAELLDRKDANIKTLSGGMKRKLMIVRAMLHNPKILIMDEPTVGLDVASRRKIWDYLKALHYNNVTILLTTHYIEEAERLCDKVAFLNRGNVVALDTPKKLISSVGDYALDIFNLDEDRTDTKFFKERDDAVKAAASYTMPVKIRNTNLEDTFVKITKEEIK